MFNELITIPENFVSVEYSFENFKNLTSSNNTQYKLNDITAYNGISQMQQYAVLGKEPQILVLQIKLNNDELFYFENSGVLWQFINSVYRGIKQQIFLIFDFENKNKFKLCIPPLNIGKRDPNVNISSYAYLTCWIHTDYQSLEVKKAIDKINTSIAEENNPYQSIENSVKDITIYPIEEEIADKYLDKIEINAAAQVQIKKENYLERFDAWHHVYLYVDREDLFVAIKKIIGNKNINSLDEIIKYIDIMKCYLNINHTMMSLCTSATLASKIYNILTEIDPEKTPSCSKFVNYYDAIKLCNIRSEIEGLLPFYADSFNTNIEADGYRLPTEIELKDYCHQILDPGTGKTIPVWSDEWDNLHNTKKTYSLSKSLIGNEQVSSSSPSCYSNCARVRMIRNVPSATLIKPNVQRMVVKADIQKRIKELNDFHLTKSVFIKLGTLEIEQKCCWNEKISWRDAVVICFLRSARDKMTPYYTPEYNDTANRLDIKQNPSATGYRLPTKQELDNLFKSGKDSINEIWCIDNKQAKIWSKGIVKGGDEAFVRMVLNAL